MARYDFKSLSPQDFEELTRDLLQAEWGVPLESFKAGRDAGIDLRYAPSDGGTTIVQCKHYASSGFRKLLAHLRDSEYPKVTRLAPRRYVVVTSVALTPAEKDAIVSVLQPFVLGVRDVFGADDLEGLLSRHPAIERSNFKLWLTSMAVLERVLYNAELCETDFQVERIRRKLPLFVQNEAFPRAKQLLEEHRVVVVSGVPGIGKTTLAEMLLYAHLEDGYEPVVIQAEVSEGKKFFKPKVKQIFYYDDFLGQTFLGDHREYLSRNQDVAIVNFIEMVRQSAHARFILTTREHILRKALQISERLAHSSLLEQRCILELSDYSYGQRARILYNHLYFSDLSQNYKEAILEGDFFLTIIKHEHFNPRLVEWLSTHARLRDVAPTAYRAHISKLLESPETIWAHAFRNQISDAARHALLCLYTLGEWIDIVDLEPAFVSLHRASASKYRYNIAPGDFRSALQELDGAFLSYSSGHASYLNPSIREFVASVICSERETAEDLLSSAIRFKQIANLWELSVARPTTQLREVLLSNFDRFHNCLATCLNSPSMRWEKMRDGTRRGYMIDRGEELKISFLVEVAEVLQSPQLGSLASQYTEVLTTSWKHHAVDFRSVLSLLEDIGGKTWFLGHGGRAICRKLLDGVLDEIAFATADDWLILLAYPQEAWEWTDADEDRLSSALKRYREHGVNEDRHNCTTLDELTQLRESLDELSKKFSLDFTRDIEHLDEDIAEREDSYEPLAEGSGFSRKSPASHHEVVTDEDVRQMFITLVDGD